MVDKKFKKSKNKFFVYVLSILSASPLSGLYQNLSYFFKNKSFRLGNLVLVNHNKNSENSFRCFSLYGSYVSTYIFNINTSKNVIYNSKDSFSFKIFENSFGIRNINPLTTNKDFPYSFLFNIFLFEQPNSIPSSADYVKFRFLPIRRIFNLPNPKCIGEFDFGFESTYFPFSNKTVNSLGFGIKISF